MQTSRLKSMIPSAILKELDRIPECNTPIRTAHFLAQCSHESADFKHMVENLNYSRESLLRVWKKYFNLENVDFYHGNSARIANRIYANRMGNGDEASGDGYKFRGRGALQLTGKRNYTLFNATLNGRADVIKNPDLVATDFPLESAAWYFTHNDLWPLCDSEDSIEKLTRRINGGLLGLSDRARRFKQFYSILAVPG